MNANLPVDWLEYLGNHAIFKKQQFSQPLDAKRSTRLMAFNGTHLFVAVDSKIRVLNLNTFKDEWISAAEEAVKGQVQIDSHWFDRVPFKVLDTPEIDFPIASITLNHNGRLLAVAGDRGVAVIRLPAYYAVGPRIQCKTFVIGGNVYTVQRIINVNWHALSENNSHLLILSDDNQLRLFDLLQDTDRPEQSFTLESGQSAVASFTLGASNKDASDWEPFTVYYALRDGSVYSLCPVMPATSMVCRQHLHNLLCLAKYRLQNEINISAKDGEDDAVYFLRALQYFWLRSLVSTATPLDTGLPNREAHVVTVNNPFTLHPQCQGPAIVLGSSPQGAVPCDMMYKKTSAADMLIVAYTNGLVRTNLLGTEIEPQWRITDGDWSVPFEDAMERITKRRPSNRWQDKVNDYLSSKENIPVIAVIETLHLHRCQGPMSIVSDPWKNDTFFVYHIAGVHTIDMPWIADLEKVHAKCLDGADEKAVQGDLGSWISSGVRSNILQLIDSAPIANSEPQPITGLVIVANMYLSSVALSISSSNQVQTVQLDSLAELLYPQQQEKPKGAVLPGSQAHTSSPLSHTPFTSPKELNRFEKLPKIVVPSEMHGKEIVITEESLRFFEKQSEDYSRQILALTQAKEHIASRLKFQKDEWQWQVEQITSLKARIHSICSEEVRQQKRDQALDLERDQFKLKLRVYKTLRDTMEKFQPELTEQEKECLAELTTIQKSLNSDDGYKNQMDKLQEELKELMITDKEQKQGAKKPSCPLTSSQAIGILHELKKLSPMLDSAVRKSRALDERLGGDPTSKPLLGME